MAWSRIGRLDDYSNSWARRNVRRACLDSKRSALWKECAWWWHCWFASPPMQGHRAFAMRILEGPFDCVWRGEAEAIAFHRRSAYGIFAEDLTPRTCNCLSDFGPPIVSQPACQFPRRSTIHNFCQAACQLPTTVEPCGRFVLAGLAALSWPCGWHVGFLF